MGDLDPFVRKVERFARNLDGDAMTSMLDKVGMGLKEDIEDAVRGDIGDRSMSGWTRQSPFNLTGRYESTPTTLEIRPANDGAQWSKGLGPMRVLENGRRAYAAGDMRSRGFGKARKDGTRKEKFSKVTRKSGATRGKSTWSDAEALMKANYGRRADDAWHEMVTDTFGG